MAPLIILLSCFVAFYLLNRFLFRNKYSASFQGRVALAIMLVITGVAHFTKTEAMAAMLPDFIPHKEVVVYLTGVLEILAAIGLLTSKYSRQTSILLILFFICILPANIVGSMKSVTLGGMENGPSYLYFRIPLQIFFIAWTYYFGLRINTAIKIN